MPVGIHFPGRNDRDLWRNRVQKIRRRGVLAAMVANLQHFGLQGFALIICNHGSLGLLLGVAGQENAALPELQSHHQRVIIFWRSGWVRLQIRRPKKSEEHAIPIKTFSSHLLFDRNVIPRREFHEPWKSAARSLSPDK